MREIKFRAWDKKRRKMREVQTIRLFHKVGHRLIKDRVWLIGGNLSGYHFQDAELMQFTGLKDKNGKEIYEGDVMCNPYNKDSSNKFVCWNETCEFVLKKDKRARTWFDLGWVDGKSFYEVIGNIYENPELLKEKKRNEFTRT